MRNLRHLFGGLLLSVTLAFLSSCTDGNQKLLDPTGRAVLDYLENCGDREMPCMLDGLWVVATPGTPRTPTMPEGWTPCTSVAGGCFPQSGTTTVVWGNRPVGGGEILASDPAGSASGSGTPDEAQFEEIKRAIGRIGCSQVRNDLLNRLNKGLIVYICWGSNTGAGTVFSRG
jgi:hypothetical protein